MWLFPYFPLEEGLERQHWEKAGSLRRSRDFLQEHDAPEPPMCEAPPGQLLPGRGREAAAGRWGLGSCKLSRYTRRPRVLELAVNQDC